MPTGQLGLGAATRPTAPTPAPGPPTGQQQRYEPQQRYPQQQRADQRSDQRQETRTCRICGQVGHLSYNCPKRLKDMLDKAVGYVT